MRRRELCSKRSQNSPTADFPRRSSTVIPTPKYRNRLTGIPKRVHLSMQACYIDHMRRRLRSFFLCLLIVSLPMHGIAGVARFACGMSHPASLVYGAEPDMALAVVVADAGSQKGDHEHAVLAAQSSFPLEGDCESTSTDAYERSSCGTCAGFSIGACAPPPVGFLSAVEGPANGLQQFSPTSSTGHIPARIERPPSLLTPTAA